MFSLSLLIPLASSHVAEPTFFFLEYAGELHIIALIEGEFWPK